MLARSQRSLYRCTVEQEQPGSKNLHFILAFGIQLNTLRQPSPETETITVTSSATSMPAITLERLLQSESFIADAKRFAAIPDEMFDRAVNAIRDAQGFVGVGRLNSIINSVFDDEALTASLTHFVSYFGQVRRDLDIPGTAFSGFISDNLPSELDEVRDIITKRLPQVLIPFDGIERQAKVERIARKTGAHLDDFAFISDLRPVFDSEGGVVEGLIPLTTLKLVVHRIGDKSPTTVEVYITENELDAFQQSLERAKRKLNALKQFVKNSNVELPESVMTLSEPNEP